MTITTIEMIVERASDHSRIPTKPAKGGAQVTSQTIAIPVRTGGLRSRLAVAAPVFALGAVVVFLVGFAHPLALHNAAHDTRHALSFPCH
jgi:cobalt transporter subunit CbtB